MEKNYDATRRACYIGYITQAIINNLPPLLFVIFSTQFGFSLSRLTLLISINFITQLLTDLAAAKFADKVGYRILVCLAHFFSAAGLVMLGILPLLLNNPWPALVLATVVNGFGGGLLEVIVSPIVEALPPGKNGKAASMSFLHSFYCWGSVGVILLSTLFLKFFGHSAWPVLPILWALLPLVNGLRLTRLPIQTLSEASGLETIPLKKLFTKKIFLLLFLLMICSGASELAMSQWASFFAEKGLAVNKTLGDLLGPCLFAVFMGSARVFFGIKSEKINMEAAMIACGALCILSYLTAALSPWPFVSLLGCAVCGLSVGIMWPGTFTLAAKHLPQGGTAMFAILALAGDLGCTSGPALVGSVSNFAQKHGGSLVQFLARTGAEAAALKTGLLFAIIFPLVLIVAVFLLKNLIRKDTVN